MCTCWIVTSIILAGKRDSRRHRVTTDISENVVVTEQVIKCLKFYRFAIGISLMKLIHFLFIYIQILRRSKLTLTPSVTELHPMAEAE